MIGEISSIETPQGKIILIDRQLIPACPSGLGMKDVAEPLLPKCPYGLYDDRRCKWFGELKCMPTRLGAIRRLNRLGRLIAAGHGVTVFSR